MNYGCYHVCTICLDVFTFTPYFVRYSGFHMIRAWGLFGYGHSSSRLFLSFFSYSFLPYPTFGEGVQADDNGLGSAILSSQVFQAFLLLFERRRFIEHMLQEERFMLLAPNTIGRYSTVRVIIVAAYCYPASLGLFFLLICDHSPSCP